MTFGQLIKEERAEGIGIGTSRGEGIFEVI